MPVLHIVVALASDGLVAPWIDLLGPLVFPGAGCSYSAPLSRFFPFLFLAILGFELRASCLLVRYSYCLSRIPIPSCFSFIFQVGSHAFAQDWNWTPILPSLHLGL
jgi:hypothetical protein